MRILKDVTATISTKDRLETLLITLTSLSTNTKLPGRLIIYDDSESDVDLYGIKEYDIVLNHLKDLGVQIDIFKGGKCGQVFNHIRALTDATTDYIFRLDDDNIIEANVLEVLYDTITLEKGIGAVSCLVPVKGYTSDKEVTTKIEINEDKDVPQVNNSWVKEKGDKIEVQSLYSVFLFNRLVGIESGGYPDNLSPVGYCEETIFTHRIFRKGYKIIVTSGATIHHLRYGSGGIRSADIHKLEFFEHDWKIYLDIIKNEWGLSIDEESEENSLSVYICNGIGDHYMFKSLIPEALKKYSKLNIYCCYMDVFKNMSNVNVIPIDIVFDNWKKEGLNPEKHYDELYNPYSKTDENCKTITETFRKIYGI